MARKKTQEELDAQNNPVAEPEVNDTPVIEPDEVKARENESAKNESAKNEKTESGSANEIPKFAARLLRLFSNYEELYVSDSGSVYTPDTKPAIRGNAILYKNPYFNDLKTNN